jgi:hypothetical protein
LTELLEVVMNNKKKITVIGNIVVDNKVKTTDMSPTAYDQAGIYYTTSLDSLGNSRLGFIPWHAIDGITFPKDSKA